MLSSLDLAAVTGDPLATSDSQVCQMFFKNSEYDFLQTGIHFPILAYCLTHIHYLFNPCRVGEIVTTANNVSRRVTQSSRYL